MEVVVLFIIIIYRMIKSNEVFGYALDGTPIDYIDEEGILWIYQGKGQDGIDHWMARRQG